MTTLSVPLPAHLEEFINRQVKSGRSPNKAAVVRTALKLLSEEEAVQAVLRAEREPILRGDLKVLARKLRTK
ncbi:MAG: type II toxin-antitoxin system ParD family antitoxin [Candidatus Taylorbacteria bacterium]|nr:type II toxin-antitoxin system ParD family antitoxin [Candidatus Taylorbacteria bacterium]